jgi:hypothetical protein
MRAACKIARCCFNQATTVREKVRTERCKLLTLAAEPRISALKHRELNHAVFDLAKG